MSQFSERLRLETQEKCWSYLQKLVASQRSRENRFLELCNLNESNHNDNYTLLFMKLQDVQENLLFRKA